MTGNEYRDLIADYVYRTFPNTFSIYTEISLGKTIIGKDRRIDVFLVSITDRSALAIECKYQDSVGTTDEKIPYALADLEALWVPGCLVYAGDGWSRGVLHTLEGSRRAAYCLPPDKTRELEHIIAATFGLWDHVLPTNRLFRPRAQ